MIQRFHVHNYRCLENFVLPIAGKPSTLLIGNNGAGKTTVSFAFEILQMIARGTNRVGALVRSKDFAQGRTDVPMRFEIELELQGSVYHYTIAFELPENFKELRVLEEKLAVDGRPIYSRERAQVQLARAGQEREASFRIDWHLVALPIVQEQSSNDPLFIFKQWLSRMLILRPLPSLITGDSEQAPPQPEPPNSEVSDLGQWFSRLLAYAPATYTRIDEYLKAVMPDLKDIQNPRIGKDFQSLVVQFSNDKRTLSVPFRDLSDGEKCFMICALVLVTHDTYPSLFCFWDEPANYLALSEVGHFVGALRKDFQTRGQFIATSHNQEAIDRFSDENTLWLYRHSHLEPTMVRPVEELRSSGALTGDLVNALVRNDLAP